MPETTDLEARSKQILKIEANMNAIRHKIVVLSGKGGVGKTTVAVGLAISLARLGNKVGIMDADLHGPNVALMLGLEGLTLEGFEGSITPLETENKIKVISMANLLPDANTPVIWRGPAKIGAIRQFLSDSEWGELDYLVIDSPPGTGDEPMTIAQSVPKLDGAVIVTTPQNVALLDTRKSINFAKQIEIPIIGLIENMSGLTCPHCGGKIEPFKSGGGERAAKEMGVPFLGKIPMDVAMMDAADQGKMLMDESSPSAKAFDKIVKNIMKAVGK